MKHTFSSYQSPFTWRYGSDTMRHLFSEQHKYELWRKMWVALAKAEHKAGLVSAAELKDLEAHKKDIDIYSRNDGVYFTCASVLLSKNDYGYIF